MIPFKNLQFRLLATLTLILSILFYSFGYLVIRTLENSYQQSIESTLFTVLKDIKHDYNEEPEKPISFEETQKEFDVPVLYAQIVAYDSLSNTPKILQKSSDLEEQTLMIEPTMIQKIFERPKEILFSKESHSELSHHQLFVGTMFLAQTEFQMLFLQCAIPYNTHTPQIKAMTFILSIGLSLLLGIIVTLAFFLIKQSLKSVQNVTDTVKVITTQDFNTTIPQTHVAHEIDDLIQTFNTLLNALQNAYAQVKQFGQNASHELKTPLTIMKGEIEVGLRKERTKEEYQAILERISKEVSALHEIIEKILFLSSNTKHELQHHFSDVYIDEVLLEVIEEKRSLCHAKEITLYLESIESLTIQGHSTLLKMAIANLIDNAIKYSAPNTTITIILNKAYLRISDQGIGMSEEEMSHVFEQFYRGVDAKAYASGSGLGLSLVKAIIELHDIHIEIESQRNQGTTTRLLF